MRVKPTKSAVSAGAKAMSERGASLGGKARAESMTSSRRTEIARDAALARWGDIHVATHTGELRIGDRVLSCAVLEDGTRVLSQSTFLDALGRNTQKSRRGPAEDIRAPFLSAQNIQPFITDDVRAMAEPIAYRVQGVAGRAWGYQANLLPQVCDIYLSAREAKALAPSQRLVAEMAIVLVRGLARVGIVALVDEATGYQETRARNELQLILEMYVAAEFRPWLKRFPDEFFQQIYRLQGWEFRPGTSKRTPQVGKLVNRYIYDQLPPGVHEELRRLNPRTETGGRRHKHHQLLTETTGHPHLDRQISTVTTLMRIANSKTEFETLFERAFPPVNPRLPLIVDVPADPSA